MKPKKMNKEDLVIDNSTGKMYVLFYTVGNGHYLAYDFETGHKSEITDISNYSLVTRGKVNDAVWFELYTLQDEGYKYFHHHNLNETFVISNPSAINLIPSDVEIQMYGYSIEYWENITVKIVKWRTMYSCIVEGDQQKTN